MSNPTPTTVRGWLQAIFNSLQGIAQIGELVSELRFMQRRLFGADSQGTEAGLLEQPTIIGALYHTDANAPGGATRYALASYLYKRLGTFDETTILQRLAALELTNQQAVNWLVDLYNLENTIKLSIGFGTGINSLTTAASDSRNTLALISSNTSKLLSAMGEIVQGDTSLTARAYLALIADSTERSADCCEENSGPSGDPPPPYDPAVCPDYELGLQSSGLSFGASGIVPYTEFVNMGTPLVLYNPIGGPNGEPAIQAVQSSVVLCYQLKTSPQDLGQYTLFVTGYIAGGTPAPGNVVFYLNGPGPFELPLFTTYEGQEVFYIHSFRRENVDTGEFEKWEGFQPVLYVDVAQLL